MILFSEIHGRAVQAAQSFNRAEAHLISILQEVESSKTYVELGYPSLFQYVVGALKLSESVASNFITVSRKAREFPALQTAITQGDLTVSKARKVTSVLTSENQQEWVQKAIDLPQRALEQEVACLAPEQSIREGVKAITGDLSELRVGISRELEEKLKRVQDLESQRTSRAIRLSEALEALVDLYLERKDPVKRAERMINKGNGKKDSKNDADACVVRLADRKDLSDIPGNFPETPIIPSRSIPSRSIPFRSIPFRSIPSQAKHQVNLRDLGQCAYIHPNGKRCESKRWLDVHHVVHRSQGGTNAIANLILLCSGHHRMQH